MSDDDSQEVMRLFNEEMQTEEIHLKVNAIHRLKIVMMTLDKKQISDQLIGILDKLIDSQDDEVLFAIAEELGSCFELLSDFTQFLPLLEKLARSDETVVREQSQRSLITISKLLDEKQIEQNFTPLVIRLAQSEWFTGRVSSCSLFQFAYPRAGAQKERLRKKFMELCQEDTPMIRRACASKLGEFSMTMDKQHVITELLPIFRQLAQDEQDAIRVLCLESLIYMASYLNKEENQVHTLGTLLAAGEDKSWKVRLCFAKSFAKFAEAFGKEISDAALIQIFSLLLSDTEPEVKNAAITSLSQSLKNLSVEKISNLIFPTLASSYQDSQTSFKAGVALALCEMSSTVGKQFTEDKILGIVFELMKDDNAEVRLNIVQNLIKIAEVAQQDCLSPSFLAILNNLTKDSQWRVRMAAIELVGDMGIKFGKEAFFKFLEPIFMQYLNNTAAAVREMGIEKVKKMAKEWQGNWVVGFFIPKIVERYNQEKIAFHYRVACLMSIAAVFEPNNLQKGDIVEKIIPILKKAMKDKVPNVKFCVCRILKDKKQYIPAEVWNVEIEPTLKELTDDEDKDVCWFAMLAYTQTPN